MLIPLLLLLAATAPAQDASGGDEASAATGSTCPDVSWPTEAWPEGPEPPADAVQAFEAFLFPPDLDRDDPERGGTRTDGVVVVHDGAILYERYGGGYGPEQAHLTWSVTKSFTNALTGIAVRRGLLSLDDSICDHIEVGDPDSCAITVQHLLEFSSGWDWRETYEGYSPTASSVIAMLYGEGRDDMARFVTGHPLRDEPGTTWMYSSGDTVVLASVLGAAFAESSGPYFPFEVLLKPIGMRTATWERDAAGTYVGSSYLWASPRDMARFGYFLLQDGCWGGRRLLPAGWVEASTRVSEPLRTEPLARKPGDVQGRQFWLNRPVPAIGQEQPPWPEVPVDAFAARGHWKQSINVIPSRDLVVVRTADDRDGEFDHGRFLDLALDLLPEEAP